MKNLWTLPIFIYGCVAYAQPNIEFLHWWTSHGEDAALSVLEQRFDSLPVTLTSEAVVGGGGAPAKATLKARAIAGSAPDIAQMEGPAIQSWAMLGFLQDIDAVAREQEWDEKLYPSIREIHKYQGRYVALPLNVHRINWMWVNHSVLARYGLSTPTDWSSLIDVLTQLKAKGVNPLALGKDQWQIVQIFENIAYGVGGAQYYKRAFVDLDIASLNSKETQEALDRFRTIADIVGDSLPNISWNKATQALIAGEYAVQLTGDWALGEVLNSPLSQQQQIECVVFPSTENGFIYNIDSLAFFNNSAHLDVSSIVASLAEPDLLLEFSQKKGSIPAFKQIPQDRLSPCQVESVQDYQSALKRGTAMPSIIDSMAVDPIVQNAVSNELYRFFMDSSISTQTLIGHLSAINFNNLN